MTNFPLYDSIEQKILELSIDKDSSVTSENKNKFVEFVKTTGEDIHQLIYMLIKVHQLKYDTTSSTNLPFNGKEQKCGLKFDIDILPSHLQHILIQFSNMQQEKN